MDLYNITFQDPSETDENLTGFQYVAANSMIEAIECYEKIHIGYILKAEYIDEIIIQKT